MSYSEHVRKKKVVALLPFRNEAHFLPNFMKQIEGIVDEILGYDDFSTDESKAIFLNLGGTLVDRSEYYPEKAGVGATNIIRDLLLEEGRKLGGTHFVILDADEFFVGSSKETIRDSILSLKPGMKLLCNWVMLSPNGWSYRDERSVWKPRMKDFCFADDLNLRYPVDKFVHFARTPIFEGLEKRDNLHVNTFSVIHLQFYNWELGQIKQCWYRLQECLILGRNYVKVNRSYAFTKEKPSFETESPISETFKDFVKISELDSIKIKSVRDSWYFRDIQNVLLKTPKRKVRNLDIWFLPEMQRLYLEIYETKHSQSLLYDVVNKYKLRLHHIHFIVYSTVKGVLNRLKHDY